MLTSEGRQKLIRKRLNALPGRLESYYVTKHCGHGATKYCGTIVIPVGPGSAYTDQNSRFEFNVVGTAAMEAWLDATEQGIQMENNRAGYRGT